MTQTAKLLERLYPSRVLNHMTLTTDEFWESKMLEANDWLGETAPIYESILHGG